MGNKSHKEIEDAGSNEDVGNLKSKGSSKLNQKSLLIDERDAHEDAINCIALSDDGSLLVTGGDDCVARMWSTKAPGSDCLGELEGHSSYITCIAIVDTFVVTGSADNTVRKWDMTNCDCLFVFEGHESRICRLICTSEFIFTSSYDKTARIWMFGADKLEDQKSNKVCVGILKGHAKAVYPLVYIPSNGIPTQVEIEENHVDINPGDLIITGSADCTARSWSLGTKGCLKVFHGHTMPIMCMAADVSGKTLFTAGGDPFVLSWDVKTGTVLKEFAGHNSAIIGLQVVNRLLYTASSDQTVRAWVIEFGDCTRVFKGHDHTVTCFKFSDGYVITGCGDGVVRVFDAKSGHLRQQYKAPNGAATALAVVDRKLFTTCVDGKIRVWNAEHLIKEDTSAPLSNKLHANQDKLEELEHKLDGYAKFGTERMDSHDEVDYVKEINNAKNLKLNGNNLPTNPNIPGVVDQAVNQGKQQLEVGLKNVPQLAEKGKNLTQMLDVNAAKNVMTAIN